MKRFLVGMGMMLIAAGLEGCSVEVRAPEGSVYRFTGTTDHWTAEYTVTRRSPIGTEFESVFQCLYRGSDTSPLNDVVVTFDDRAGSRVEVKGAYPAGGIRLLVAGKEWRPHPLYPPVVTVAWEGHRETVNLQRQ